MVYNSNSAIAMGLMFGLIGIVMAFDKSNSEMSMLINCYFVQRSFLSHNKVKAVRITYHEFFNDLKKSKKKQYRHQNYFKKK